MWKLIRTAALVAAALAATSAVAADGGSAVVGQYVETRTAEVFTGACLMNSDGETGGREALMAWRIERGRIDGVPVDGLSVVAAVTSDINLGTRELGGAAPSSIRSVLYVDERADAAQRRALVTLARSLSNGFVGSVVAVKPVEVTFAREAENIAVRAGEVKLDVVTRMEHDVNCSAMQWFHPLASVQHATMGVTREQQYSGSLLGRRWTQTDRRSAFFGEFKY